MRSHLKDKTNIEKRERFTTRKNQILWERLHHFKPESTWHEMIGFNAKRQVRCFISANVFYDTPDDHLLYW
jgi:hypothetical protein